MNLMQLASMFRGQQPNSGGAFGQPYDARMPDTTQVGSPYDAKMPDATQIGAPYDAKMPDATQIGTPYDAKLPQPGTVQPWSPLGVMQGQQQQPSLQNIYRSWLSGARGGLGRGLY